MDLILISTIIGIIGGIITLFSVPSLIEWYKDKHPFIKKFLYSIFNKSFNVKIKGVKKYYFSDYDLKLLKQKIHEKYSAYKIDIPKKNSMNILMKNMQAPYKILFLPDFNQNEKMTKVIISLEGEVKFSYNSNQNKYLNIIDEIFTLIEEEYPSKISFKWFTLTANINKLEEKPLKNSFITLDCEDTHIEIDKSNKFLKINSDSINNMITCLNTNIEKVI